MAHHVASSKCEMTFLPLAPSFSCRPGSWRFPLSHFLLLVPVPSPCLVHRHRQGGRAVRLASGFPQFPLPHLLPLVSLPCLPHLVFPSGSVAPWQRPPPPLCLCLVSPWRMDPVRGEGKGEGRRQEEEYRRILGRRVLALMKLPALWR